MVDIATAPRLSPDGKRLAFRVNGEWRWLFLAQPRFQYSARAETISELSTWTPLVAASRDASWYNRPDVRRTKILHVTEAEPQMAALCSGAPLDENSAWSLADVPPGLRCRRMACAQYWAVLG